MDDAGDHTGAPTVHFEEVLATPDVMRCVHAAIDDDNPDVVVRTMESLSAVNRGAHAACRTNDGAWTALLHRDFPKMLACDDKLAKMIPEKGLPLRNTVRWFCLCTRFRRTGGYDPMGPHPRNPMERIRQEYKQAKARVPDGATFPPLDKWFDETMHLPSGMMRSVAFAAKKVRREQPAEERERERKAQEERAQEPAQKRIRQEEEQWRLEKVRREREEARYQKKLAKMMSQERRRKCEYVPDGRNSDPPGGKIKLTPSMPSERNMTRVDEASKKRKAPEELTVRCARCRTTRTIQGKPCAGWDCSDGGYTCKQRYECKHCNRSFYREGDPSDDLECKDFDKECLPIKKKK